MMTETQAAINMALATGRGEFIRALDACKQKDADIRALCDALANQIDANAANYARYVRLRAEGQRLMAHVVTGTARQVALIAAIADPQYPVDEQASDDALRARTDDIMHDLLGA